MNGMEVHELNIKRASNTRTPIGGNRTTYTTAARGTLPTRLRGRAIAMSAKEKMDHGVRSEQFGWKFLIPQKQGDPEADQRDRIEFEYTPGDNRTAKVVVAGRGRIGTQNTTPHHYVLFGIEDGTES